MTKIKLTNTKTRQKEDFAPISADNVRMYVCGPTVYDRAHIGNARPVVVFDVLYRLLRHVYGEGHVTYVRNFTDVDDRINETAQKRKAAGAEGTLEALIRERSDETIKWYHDDMDALGALRPTEEPRATEYIREMVDMIEDLIAKGHAYDAEGHVLFSVKSDPDYGSLSGRSVDDMIAGARVEVAPYKRNPMDFVLWKPSDDGLPGWESPWGRGRPGWHIECSAMSKALLGETFDIHGGGLDLQFPHHENEIAQSKCAHGADSFAKVWMHNEMLQVEGKKMSKSLGNFFTVRDLLDQGVPGEVIRFVLLSTHYSKPMDWTEKKRDEASRELRKWRRATIDVESADPPTDFLQILADDVNTAGAIGELRKLFSKRKEGNGSLSEFVGAAQTVGLLTSDLANWDWKPTIHQLYADGVGASAEVGRPSLRVFDDGIEVTSNVDGPPVQSNGGNTIQEMLLRRIEAKKNKDFSLADSIRQKLSDAGVVVKDSVDGSTWELRPDFDPSKLEGL